MSNTIDICETGYNYEQFQMNELENENMKLKEQLAEAEKTLKSIQKDFERNKACDKDCVGFCMYYSVINYFKKWGVK